MLPRTRRSSLALLALLAVDCAGGAHRGGGAPTPVAPVLASPVTASEVLLPPPFSDLAVSRVGSPGDEARYLLAGARAERSAGGVVVGDHAFRAPIVAAARGAAGWVFAAADGSVARSATFLGRLQRVSDVPGMALPPGGRHSRARVPLVAGRALYTTDGASPASPTASAGPVIDAAFVSDAVGAAVLDGGALMRTADGGASWDPVDLGDAAAVAVEVRGDALVVETSRDPVVLGADGGVTRPAPARPAVQPVPRDEAAGVLRAYLRRHPALLEVHGARRADGRYVLPLAEALEVFDADGSFVRALEVVGRCSVRAWGAALVATCASGGPGALRSVDGERFAPIAALSAPYDPSRVQLSDDGLHAAALRGCEAEANARTEEAGGWVCALSTPEGRWRAVPLPHPVGTLLGVHGARALAWVTVDEGDYVAAVIDLDAGTLRLLRLAGEECPRGADWRSLGWAPDGTVVGVLSEEPRAGARPRLVTGSPDAELATSELPEGTIDVGFADARRGVAETDSPARLFRTTDGGRSWAPTDATLPDEAHLPRRPPGDDRARHVRCSEAGCASARAVVHGWGAPVLRGEAPFALPPAGPDEFASLRERVPALWMPTRESLTSWSVGCTNVGRPVTRPVPPDAGAELTSRVTAARGWLAATASGGATTLRARWRGVDARGAFEGASRAVPLPEGMGTSGELMAVTRAGALVRTPGGFAFRWYWARDRAAVTALDLFGGSVLLGATATDAGGLVLLVGDGETFELAPDGALRRRDDYRWADGFRMGPALARRGDRYGVAVAAHSLDRWTFHAFGARLPAGELTVRELWRVQAPCVSPRAPGTVVLYDSSEGEMSAPSSPALHIGVPPGDVFATEVEVGAAGACVRVLRSAHRTTVGYPAAAPATVLTARPDGSFVGTQVSGERFQGVRCLEPPPDRH